MTQVITTGEFGTERVEANIQTALRQGRISQREVPEFRAAYARGSYEEVTQLLLGREVNPDAALRAPAPMAASEAAYREFAYSCGIPGYK